MAKHTAEQVAELAEIAGVDPAELAEALDQMEDE
jgi:DNA-binding MarR family transcriptional regulator